MPKRYKKYKRGRRRSRRVPRQIKYNGPLQKTLKTRLTYSDIYTMTNGSGTMSSRIMRINGMRDPDVTGTGHQPRGFDELMSLYDHFVVIGAKVELCVVNTSDTAPCTFSAVIRDNNITISDYLDYLESPMRKTITLSPSDGGSSSRKLTFNVNPNTFLGRSKPMSDPELKGSAASDPTEMCYLHFGHTPTDLASVSTIAVTATITYTAVLIEPKNPTQS